MPRILKLTLAILLTLLLIQPPSLPAGDKKQDDGWRFLFDGKTLDATHPAGEWNHIQIIVAPAGETSSVWMNGVKYEEWIFNSDAWKQNVAKSKFATAPLYAKKQRGHIVLQDHDAAVSFRDIKIRDWKKPVDEKK